MQLRAFILALGLSLATLTSAYAEEPSALQAGSGLGVGTVNINTATVEELVRLPGIGPAKAAAIAAFRQKHGAFSKVDELDRVKGFGRKSLIRLRPLVSVGGATTFVGKPRSTKKELAIDH